MSAEPCSMIVKYQSDFFKTSNSTFIYQSKIETGLFLDRRSKMSSRLRHGNDEYCQAPENQFVIVIFREHTSNEIV
jgi:hypothetical protein